jgi:hypothetical protein
MSSPSPSTAGPPRAVPGAAASVRRPSPGVVAALWLLGFGALGATLVRLYPDSYQQDGGFHYLFSRWSLAHPRLFLDVWGRPLFTLLYAGPAQLGYPAAKLLTVAVAVATGWQTYRLAREAGLERPALAVPLLWLQPAFLLLSSETMTEPLFALVLTVALRLHLAGRIRWGMVVASLLPLARPEGFFVGVLWGLLVVLDQRTGAPPWWRALSSLWLALGVALWWGGALLMTGDPLYIPKVWPRDWGATGGIYGIGPWWHFLRIRDQILAGPVLQGLFVLGLGALAARRRLGAIVATALLVPVLHAAFFVFGFFGSAGYARYLVCVAPPLALVTLAGWNAAARGLARLPRAVTATVAALTLAAAVVHCLLNLDRYGSSRDALAAADTYAWFRANQRPVRRLVFSQAYMSILFGRDPAERPLLTKDREQNVQALRASPPGTLVFWDARTGPAFRNLGPYDLERAGYHRLYAASYDLRARWPTAKLLALHWLIPAAQWPQPYRQEMFLYYKE